jgi:hypothetical protein
MSIWKKYGYMWVTLVLFLASFAGHWTFAWFHYANEQEDHSRQPVVSEYLAEVGSETLENWQSEFLKLIWQVAGLAFLMFVGSPQSKDGDARKEQKMDEILRLLDATQAEDFIRRLDEKYPRQ